MTKEQERALILGDGSSVIGVGEGVVMEATQRGQTEAIAGFQG